MQKTTAEGTVANVVWAAASQELGFLGMCFHKVVLAWFLWSRMWDKMTGELQAQGDDSVTQQQPLSVVLCGYFSFFQASKFRTKSEDEAQHSRPLQSTSLWSFVDRAEGYEFQYQTGFKYWLYSLLPMWLWVSYLISLSLSSLSLKMKIRIAHALKDFFKD